MTDMRKERGRMTWRLLQGWRICFQSHCRNLPHLHCPHMLGPHTAVEQNPGPPNTARPQSTRQR